VDVQISNYNFGSLGKTTSSSSMTLAFFSTLANKKTRATLKTSLFFFLFVVGNKRDKKLRTTRGKYRKSEREERSNGKKERGLT
jgi:hypothetical protein